MKNLVEVNYQQTGESKKTNSFGMRDMQAKAFEKRNEQYLLLKAPPASGKSRALMFIALDKLYHQGIKKVIVAEFPKEREKEYLITKDLSQKKRPSPTVGYLGRGLLKKVNLLMDMECSKVILTNSFKKLKKSGYDLTNFEKIPFELIPKGILMLVDTDLGRMKLVLDTGCTFSMLHGFLSPQNIEEDAYSYGFPTFKSTHFTMNGIDFGSQTFYFIDMTEALNDIDGFLGMDFIKKHVMYIDFLRKILYIQK